MNSNNSVLCWHAGGLAAHWLERATARLPHSAALCGRGHVHHMLARSVHLQHGHDQIGFNSKMQLVHSIHLW